MPMLIPCFVSVHYSIEKYKTQVSIVIIYMFLAQKRHAILLEPTFFILEYELQQKLCHRKDALLFLGQGLGMGYKLEV